MTHKDFYVVLNKINKKEKFKFNALLSDRSINNKEFNKIIEEAHILVELKSKKLINNIEDEFTAGGIPTVFKYPYLTVDGYEFMKNYKGTFKNRCILIVKNIWLIIVFFFSLTGSFWALVNILSYYGFIPKP